MVNSGPRQVTSNGFNSSTAPQQPKDTGFGMQSAPQQPRSSFDPAAPLGFDGSGRPRTSFYALPQSNKPVAPGFPWQKGGAYDPIAQATATPTSTSVPGAASQQPTRGFPALATSSQRTGATSMDEPNVRFADNFTRPGTLNSVLPSPPLTLAEACSVLASSLLSAAAPNSSNVPSSAPPSSRLHDGDDRRVTRSRAQASTASVTVAQPLAPAIQAVKAAVAVMDDQSSKKTTGSIKVQLDSNGRITSMPRRLLQSSRYEQVWRTTGRKEVNKAMARGVRTLKAAVPERFRGLDGVPSTNYWYSALKYIDYLQSTQRCNSISNPSRGPAYARSTKVAQKTLKNAIPPSLVEQASYQHLNPEALAWLVAIWIEQLEHTRPQLQQPVPVQSSHHDNDRQEDQVASSDSDPGYDRVGKAMRKAALAKRSPHSAGSDFWNDNPDRIFAPVPREVRHLYGYEPILKPPPLIKTEPMESDEQVRAAAAMPAVSSVHEASAADLGVGEIMSPALATADPGIGEVAFVPASHSTQPDVDMSNGYSGNHTHLNTSNDDVDVDMSDKEDGSGDESEHEGSPKEKIAHSFERLKSQIRKSMGKKS